MSAVTLPPCGDFVIAHKYLQEGVHLLLDSIDKPPLDDQAVRGKTVNINVMLLYCVIIRKKILYARRK